jgi:hypothetical protein
MRCPSQKLCPREMGQTGQGVRRCRREPECASPNARFTGNIFPENPLDFRSCSCTIQTYQVFFGNFPAHPHGSRGRPSCGPGARQGD